MAKSPSIRRATRAEFQQLARCRVAEAKVLLSAGLWAGSYYLAGYGIECALKAYIIKKNLDMELSPDPDFKQSDFYTHNLLTLINQAQLESVFFVDHLPFWLELKQWSEHDRYRLTATHESATQLLRAVEEMLQWFEANW